MGSKSKRKKVRVKKKPTQKVKKLGAYSIKKNQ